MGAIVIRKRYDEGTESTEVATSEHWVHRTQEEDKQITKTQHRKDEQHEPHTNQRVDAS